LRESFDSAGTMSVIGSESAIAQARTRPFEVVPRPEYVAACMCVICKFSQTRSGPQQSIPRLAVTSLSQCLVRQGVRMYPSVAHHS
jgi:hypothetical protein